jgi:hypothetical protein
MGLFIFKVFGDSQKGALRRGFKKTEDVYVGGNIDPERF